MREFSELQNAKYESMGLKITLPERQLNVLLKLFKDYAENQQNKTTADLILILEDTLCHIMYVLS